VRYGLTPQGPIAIELYANPKEYAIRTVGLPQLGALGVCFGRVITAMEPGSARFSWAMVLSHELAHVFAIQLSRSRVPRWFTEGLAEWETARARPEWRRAGDADLAAALAERRVRPIAELNLGFLRARSMDEMTAAYYTSYAAVDFLARRFGWPKIVGMLRAWGEGKSTIHVLEQATGRPIAQLDAELRADLEQRTQAYRGQLHVSTSDADAQARLGLARLGARDLAAAEAAAEAALKVDPKCARAWVLRGDLAMAKRDAKAALAAYERALGAGADGYDLRMRLGAAAGHGGDIDRALAEYERAAHLDPQRPEPREERAALYEKRHQQAQALAELTQSATIDPNAGPTAARLAKNAAEGRVWSDVIRYATKAVEVDPFAGEQYELLARAQETLGKRAAAAEARELGKLARAARPPRAGEEP
jgi:tetratricopeptide (TPR) repeat protein